MKFYIIFSIIFAALIHRSNCGIFGTGQNPAAGIKGNTASGGIGVVTGTAPTCTAAQLTAMNTQIEAELMKFVMDMIVTNNADFFNAFITETLKELEKRDAEGPQVAIADIAAQVLDTSLPTFFTNFGKTLSTTALQTAINAIITNNANCAVCVPDRARINKVINDYLTGNAARDLLIADLNAASTNMLLNQAFNSIYPGTGGMFPTISTAGTGYDRNDLRAQYRMFLSDAAKKTLIATNTLTGLNTSLMTAVTSGAIGNLIDAAVAMCTTVTVAAATPTAFNTNICTTAAINRVNFLNYFPLVWTCLFRPLVG